jgi:undecaprenyl diphosphate synthase
MAQSTLQIPPHLAIIMDGNGRWAQLRGQPRTTGHLAGARVLKDVVSHSARLGISQLTLYAFSSDNWKRPTPEVQGLLALFTSHFRSQATALARNGIRLSVIGRRDRLPNTLLKAIRNAEAATAHGRVMHLRIAIDYSSRDAIQRAHAPADAHESPDGAALLPPVDLLLRTGGERRLSDFLLWECAYAELVFVDTLWPDVSVATIDQAVSDYAARDRRFGAVRQQASA